MTSEEAAVFAFLQKAYKGDAIFRPSNAYRWMTCHGSVQLIARLAHLLTPQKASAAARAGTTAHKLAQIVLTEPKHDPEDFVGRDLNISEDPTKPDLHFVDDEMGEKVTEYVDIVKGYAATPGTEVYIESKLSLASLDPSNPLYNECRGTGDAVFVNRAERWAVDLDLKYGVGVPVAGDAYQLKIYLLMVLLTFFDGKPWKWGSTAVFQPRLPVPPYSEDDHFKPFIYDPAEIMGNFLGQVLEAMHAALQPDPPLAPSLKACHWCPAGDLDMCPAKRAAGLAIAHSQFDAQPQTAAHTLMSKMTPVPQIILAESGKPVPTNGSGTALVLRPAEAFDVGELADLLGKGEMLVAWYKGIQRRAAQIIQGGIKVPGWYLAARTGNRRWKGTRQETEEALLKIKLSDDQPSVLKVTDIYAEPKMRSPKQVEDRLPKLLKGAISDLYERPAGTPVLVQGTPPHDTQRQSALVAILTPVQLDQLDQI